MLDEIRNKVINLLQEKGKIVSKINKKELLEEKRILERRLNDIEALLLDELSIKKGYKYQSNIELYKILKKILVPISIILGLILIFQFPLSVYSILALTIPTLLGIGTNSLINEMDKNNSYNYLYDQLYGEEKLSKQDILNDKKETKKRIREIYYMLDRLNNDEEYIKALNSMLREIEIYQDLDNDLNNNDNPKLREQRYEELIIRNQTINEIKSEEIQKRYYKK